MAWYYQKRYLNIIPLNCFNDALPKLRLVLQILGSLMTANLNQTIGELVVFQKISRCVV